jgi:hypothetical protein|tara:strand:- start:219 stop:716 length:498 start_codon:yes stop_codon:yes gene_type:complete
MVNRNLEGNRNYFDNLVDGVGAQSRIVFKNQLMVGDTVKFIYKRYTYTGIVASTPRALFGHYTAKNTRNRLVTMFIFSSPTFSLPMNQVITFIGEVYDKTRLTKTKKTKYIPQRNIRFKFRWDRFWSSLKRLFKIETDIPTLDSRNFRTFKMDNIGNCQRLTPRG